MKLGRCWACSIWTTTTGSADAHLAPGQGTIDFALFAAALKRANYAGYMSAELGMAYVLDPEPVVVSCLAWMRRMFE